MNITQIVFALSAFMTGLFGILVGAFEYNLPLYITRTYRYGKHATSKEHFIVQKFEVPKRWFAHFYVFSSLASSFVFALVICKYSYGCVFAEGIYRTLDILFGTERRALVTPERTILATVLLTLHCWKRFYETHYVSVFSDGRMNLAHYIAGFVHYVGATTCLIGESQGFVRGAEKTLEWNSLTYREYVAALVFLWSTYKQLGANYILANLRKDRNGKVVNIGYEIPSGELFEYISSPLQFTEISMYLMLSVILWQSSTYHYVCVWVVVNQVSCALFNHRWYLSTFPNYPKNRQILVPYIF